MSKLMLTLTDFSSPDGHTYLKCKRCKQEFYVVSAAIYVKSIGFCPYCGQRAKPQEKHDEEKYDNEY